MRPRQFFGEGTEKHRVIGFLGYSDTCLLVVAATFRMLGSTSALFPLLPYISSLVCMHGVQLRDAYKVKKDGKGSYEFRTSGHQMMPYVALLLNISSFDGCRYEDINFEFEPFRFAAKHDHPMVRDLRLHKTYGLK